MMSTRELSGEPGQAPFGYAVVVLALSLRSEVPTVAHRRGDARSSSPALLLRYPKSLPGDQICALR